MRTGALLSRMQVHTLGPLSESELDTIVRRAFAVVGSPGGEKRTVKSENGDAPHWNGGDLTGSYT
jgi:replication-associated recombination protein RarA